MYTFSTASPRKEKLKCGNSYKSEEMLMEMKQTEKLFLTAIAIHKAMNRWIPHSTEKYSSPKKTTGVLGQIYMNTKEGVIEIYICHKILTQCYF